MPKLRISHTLLIGTAVLLHTQTFQVTAQELAFDNLAARTSYTWWTEPIAQAFQLGDMDETIERVTLEMERWGNPSGSVQVELWDSNGHQPGAFVADVGFVDDFDSFPLGPGNPQLIEFSPQIAGLTPNATYWIVFISDPSYTSGSRDAFGWNGYNANSSFDPDDPLIVLQEAAWFPPLGSTGPPTDNEDWVLTSQQLGTKHFQKMSILSLPAHPEPWGDFNSDGVLDLADYQILIGNMNMQPMTIFDGDMDFDGFVSLDDFALFRREYERNNASALVAVPEPNCQVLALLGLVGLLTRRRR